jgi:hypothetical protein
MCCYSLLNGCLILGSTSILSVPELGKFARTISKLGELEIMPQFA